MVFKLRKEIDRAYKDWVLKENRVEEAKKFLIDGVVNSFDTKEGMKYNWSKDASARGWSREKRQRAKDEGSTVEAELVTDVSGQPRQASDGEMRPLDDPMSSGKEFTLRTKDGNPVKGIISNKPDAEILTLTQRGGDFFATTRSKSQSDPMSLEPDTGEANVEEIKLTAPEFNRVARKFGLKNAGELNKYLQDRAQTVTGKPDAKSLIEKYSK